MLVWGKTKGPGSKLCKQSGGPEPYALKSSSRKEQRQLVVS